MENENNQNNQELSSQIRELENRLDQSAESLQSLSVKYEKDVNTAHQNNLKLQVNHCSKCRYYLSGRSLL